MSDEEVDDNSKTDREYVLNAFVKKGAKRRKVNIDKWKDNVRKSNRQSGLAYESKKSKLVVSSKSFHVVNKCCNTSCFQILGRSEQNDIFTSFYNDQNKEAQDTYLDGCMALKHSENKKVTVEPKVVRANTWLFNLKKSGMEVPICREFLKEVLQITVKRLRVIQSKILKNLSFSKKRGKHGKQRILKEDVWKLAMQHLQSIPHRKSHYTTVTMLRFCSWLSKSQNVSIIHLYPVRGHSFDQFDRNFVMMKSYIKKEECIEMTPYLENIVTCRQNPSLPLN